MFKHIVKLSFLLSLILNQNLFCSSSSSSFVSPDAESAGMTIDDIRTNTDLLRQIALAIFTNSKEKKRIQDKICHKHSKATSGIWKEDKGDGPIEDIGGLTSKERKTAIRRNDFMVVNQDILDDIQKKGIEIINNGNIQIDQSPRGMKKIGLTVEMRYPDPVGYHYPSKDSDPVPSYVIYISFDVDAIVKDLQNGSRLDAGKGSVATICSKEG